MRNIEFEIGKHYHIFNRGIEKRNVFLDNKDYTRFLQNLRQFNSVTPIRFSKDLMLEIRGREAVEYSPLVEIEVYCLNANHFHLLLKPIALNGIPEFMKRLGGYTKYFNLRYGRVGPLFQGAYKAFYLSDQGRLWKASMYINGNAEIHGIEKCEAWPWSSCLDYLGIRNGDLCKKENILDDFADVEEYRGLLFDYIKDKRAWKEEMKQFE